MVEGSSKFMVHEGKEKDVIMENLTTLGKRWNFEVYAHSLISVISIPHRALCHWCNDKPGFSGVQRPHDWGCDK